MAPEAAVENETRTVEKRQPHPNAVPHLFKPGNPGGPGRPRKRPQSEAYDSVLQMELPMEVCRAMKLEKGSTWADAIAIAIARKAITGDVAAAKEMREAVEGKATQRIELTSPEDKGFELHVTYEAGVPEREMGKVIEAVSAVAQLEDEDEEGTPERDQPKEVSE
jgi:hypothetical protein